MSKKVGLITWHYYNNFGSVLQAFALQKTIECLGAKVSILNYRNPKYGKTNSARDNVRLMLSAISRITGIRKERFCYPYLSFNDKFLKETKIAVDSGGLRKLCKNKDIVICGSDQIWAPNVFNPIYMLEFVPSKTKKVSYAASIGLNDIPENLVDTYKDLLSDFDYISVRESAGAELLSSKCNIAADVVADPTLLLSLSEWTSLEKPVKRLYSEPFIFCYYLRKDHSYKTATISLAEELGVKIVGVSANENDESWMKLLHNIGPAEFLWLVHRSEGVLTDSYHGTIFSLLYHKKFVTFERFSWDDEICQNSRINQLRIALDVAAQIVPGDVDRVEFSDVIWENFEKSLTKYKEHSLSFLRRALGVTEE